MTVAARLRAAQSDPRDLDAEARRLNAQFGAESAARIIEVAVTELFPGRIATVSSFGAESAVLLHLAATVDPSTPVLFLDTGKHFLQSLTYRRDLAQRLGLTDVRDLAPAGDDLSAEDPKGDLWRRDADACCTIRKVRPLNAALAGFDAWVTGRKQFHGGERAMLPVFEASGGRIKVNPLARWSKADLDAYMTAHALPAHPLVSEGYPSIGCWPCTLPVRADDDVRAGRWRGLAKTECGIHRA